MPESKPSELKKILQARGFEVYRTLGNEVMLADRVRDNLLMDSAVAVRSGERPVIRIVVHARSSEFPGEGPEKLWARARRAAEDALEQGFSETTTKTVTMLDPGDRSRTLDTSYEVWLERTLSSLDELESELRKALALEKSARPDH